MPADGKGIYVDPGTEPVDHTSESGDEPTEEVTEEVDEGEPEVEEEVEGTEETEEGEEETPEPAPIPADIAQKAAFYDYVQTQEGALDYLIEAGLGLGKSMDDLEQFFLGKTTEEPTEEESEDGDQVMTRAEFRAEQAKLEGKLDERDRERQLQAQAAVVNKAATDSLKALRIGEEPLTEKQLMVVANFVDQRLDEDDYYDVAKVTGAIEEAFKDFTEAMGFTTEGKKVVKRKVVPKGLKGATGGAVTEDEPMDLEEGFRRARAQLKAAGELG